MTKSINAKSTKAEILEVVQELKQEKAKLEAEVKKLNQAPKSVEKPTPTVKETEKPMNKPPTTVQQSITGVIEGLEALQIGFGSAVSNLSEQLITEATALQDLEELVGEEIEELAELHELEAVDETTLDDLIRSYEEESETFSEEFNLRKETLEQELQELKYSWKKEQDNHNQTLKERNAEAQKTGQRNNEEYWYNLNLERNLDKDEYEGRKRQLYLELLTTRELQEKQWQDREDAIAKQEKEQTQAQEKVESFEKELEAKIKQGTEEGKGIGYYQAKVKSDLRSKEVEGERRNYQLRIESLGQTIQNQEARIRTLTQQLDASLKQVQDLAVKAIEGSSNRNSYEAMKELALEQAKNQPKNK
ncbi:MAG: hypothetical protein N5P05_003480 [Chroococcopsis gigantea SAG 12.99]|jgi:hypothetical protein|nr:hypothetical protein [Chlorogloea purpurea SAG 13.99]MDV3001874.1 hypothetical protein [Chroococcopsis gigantea SAG 12.99]